MLELDALFVSAIENDATCTTLLGGDASDTRVYMWYPMQDIVFNAGTQDVAIIYRNSFPGRPFNWSYPSQLPNITYLFRILSIDQLKLRQTAERLIELFDQGSFEATNYATKYISLSGYADGMNEGSPTHPILSKNLTFICRVVVKRGS